MKREHPEIDTRFVIDPASLDAGKILSEDVIPFGSQAHIEAMLRAQVLISTHDYGFTPDMVIFHHLRPLHLYKGLTVFLQHGIIRQEIAWYHAPGCSPDIFCTSSKREQEYVRKNFGQGDNVKLTGLCRYDHLIDRKENMILIMPTWRRYIAENMNIDEFRNTSYFKAWNAFLNSDEFLLYLQETDKNAVFYPHIEMQKYLSAFDKPAGVTFATAETEDVQDLLCRCERLITDYSSVFFDAAYMNKPVILYQFDKEEYNKGHYGKEYIDSAEFGPVCMTEEELMEAVKSEEQGREHDSFFAYHDRRNCERVYLEIIQGLFSRK